MLSGVRSKEVFIADTSTNRQQSQSAEQLRTQPGKQYQMRAQPQSDNRSHKGSGKLKGKAALITGGDSGIGRATAIAFAKEGADVAIAFLNEERDAAETKTMIEEYGGNCIAVAGDVGDPNYDQVLIDKIVDEFGTLDILINNAGEQHPKERPEDISIEQLERTFKTNLFAMFYLTQAALPYLGEGSAIVNTASVTAYKGHPQLLDYSATKGAIVSFTRSLAQMVAKRGIRVNAVAPGPIWTPLIPSTFKPDEVKSFGKDTLLGRPGQPDEVAMAYLFLASQDASYITGQTIHVNGGSFLES